MTAEEHTFDPPAVTPGAVRCGGQHYAKARHDDGAITWVCQNCGMERVIADGRGWQWPRK